MTRKCEKCGDEIETDNTNNYYVCLQCRKEADDHFESIKEQQQMGEE